MKKNNYIINIVGFILLVQLILPISVFGDSPKGLKENSTKRTIVVNGYVTDKSTGETLIGAGLVVKRLVNGTENSLERKTATADLEQRIERTSLEKKADKTKLERRIEGTITNNFGYYMIQLPEGKYEFTYSYVGYANQVIEIDLTKDQNIDIKLEPQMTISEAIVTAKANAGINSIYGGSLEIPISDIKNAPALLGEADVIKQLQIIPGVQGGLEGTSGIYIRGGNKDENLIMLDGIALYHVEHFLGIFSVFTPEAVKKVTLYKGAFPARYGGRTAGIIDVRTNDGNLKETKGSISIGSISNTMHIEGPIIKDKTSYSISARLMHSLIAKPIEFIKGKKFGGNIYFYDLNMKFTHKLSNNDRLFLNLYHGKDKLESKGDDNFSYTNHSTYYDPDEPNNPIKIKETYNYKGEIYWGNTVGSLRWNHIFGNKIFSNTTLAYNQYKMNIKTYDKEIICHNNIEMFHNNFMLGYNSGIRDLNLRFDVDYQPAPGHSLQIGSEYYYHTFLPETQKLRLDYKDEEEIVDTLYQSANLGQLKGHEIGVYIDYELNLFKGLTLNPGFRGTIFNTEGKTYISPEPRLIAKYDFSKGYAVKASYSKTSQYVHLLSDSQISLPTDLWVPITKDIKPTYNDQYTLGAYYNGLPGWEFSIEGYFKKMKNVLEYKDGMSAVGSSINWFEKVSMGEGEAKGLEFMIRKTAGKTTGNIGYTLAKSDRIFHDGSINNGKRFPFRYDRRHNITIQVNHRFNKKYDISAIWTYSSGNPMTVPERTITVMYPDGLEEADYVPSRNNFYLPASHRLNIGFNMHKQKKHGERIWKFSLYNAYNQKNPNLVFKEVDYESSNGDYDVRRFKLKKVTFLPIFPSISYTFNFK